jgi:hypothetical protein
VFKAFHMKVERETGRQLKCVRADNGGEYRGPFEEYCRSHGIRLEKTVSKTPQHNGVAERMNRTICERIRCMLSHAKLPKSFWGEAMKTAVDLINLSPSVPLNCDFPQRVWTRKDVSFEHLRVFGCRAFVHVPRDGGPSLIARLNSVSSWVMDMKSLVTDFGIQFLRKSYGAEMFSLKIKPLKTWNRLKSQSLSVKNVLIWVQLFLLV